MSAILTGLLIWFWAGAVGDKLLRAIRLKEPNPLDQLVLSTALGTGVLGLVGFALGTMGAYRSDVVWLLLIVTFAANWRYPSHLLQVARLYLIRAFAGIRSDRRFAFVLILVLAAAVLRLLAATAPPTGVDPLLYHLPLPQTYIAHRGFVFVPDVLPCGEFPQQVEMLYTLALLLGPDSAAQVIHWGFGAMLVLALYRLGRRYLNVWQSLAVAGVFYAIADVAAQSSLALVDLAVALYQLLAVTACMKYLNDRRRSWLLLSGLFVGFAAGSKYTGALIGLALAGLLVSEIARQRIGFREGVKATLLLGGIGFSLLLPWLIKDWILAGNPVSPFLSWLFSHQPYAAALARWVQTSNTNATLYPRPIIGFLMTPLWLTYRPVTLGGATIGPIFLASLPVLLWVLRTLDTLDLGRMTIVAILMLALWYFLSPIPRFVLVSFALLVVPSMVGVYRIGWSRWAERSINSLILAWCIFGMVGLTFYYDGLALSHVMRLGSETRSEYLVRALPARFSNFHWYSDILWLNDNLPPDSLVLVEDNRLPDLRVDAKRLLTWVDSWGSAPGCYQDLHACLCDSGFTHVVMRQDRFGHRWYPTGQGLEKLATQGALTLLHKGEQQMAVYQVRCPH